MGVLKVVAGWFGWQKVGHRCTSQRVILQFDLSLSPPSYNPVSTGEVWCDCLLQSVHCLLHSLPYIFLRINYSRIFNLLLSAHLFVCFMGHPSVFLSSAPVLNSSSTLGSTLTHFHVVHIWLGRCLCICSSFNWNIFQNIVSHMYISHLSCFFFCLWSLVYPSIHQLLLDCLL